ncbi:MAG: hypothetical protein ACKOCK_12975 [Chloroflexota bacterium]
MKIARIAIAPALALVVASGFAIEASAKDHAADAACGVTISGGMIANTTNVDLNAGGGSAISDASGGSNDFAMTNSGDLQVASSGNGGGANASANGGAVASGDINSGSNAGNSINVGNTHCAAHDGGAGGDVAAMPETGAGMIDAAVLSAIAGAAAAAAAGVGLRRR